MIEPTIECRGVWKYYSRYYHLQAGLKETLTNFVRPARRERALLDSFLALRDVSFVVEQGECIGIVGANGAGKTTLLSLIAGVLQPSRGQLIVRNRPYPMLELTTGFHSDMNGYENIVLNGVLLGSSRSYMKSRTDEILAFAELQDYAYEPIRTYSTGMVARLGFSILANMDPELLLIDEVLAVGDRSFQAKCLEKIAEFRRKGVTIVLVSHSAANMLSVCDRVLWIHEHSIRGDGSPGVVLAEYENE